MRVRQLTSAPTSLSGPVTVAMRSKADCAGDARLEAFRAGEGPAAREVALIVGNLLSGEALAQTVALVSDQASGQLLGIASIRLDGNVQLRAKSSTPWFLRRLATNPYVNMVARDERFANHVLCDGVTRLGTAILRAGLEVLEAEHGGALLPTTWALVRRNNAASKRVFREFAFYRHDRSAENQQDIYVRRAGRPLPPAPAGGAYVPLAPELMARDARSGRPA
jgi:hypothetical protein